MARFKIFGKSTFTRGFFVCASGSDRTRGIYTFTVDTDDGTISYKSFFKTPSDPQYAYNYGRFTIISYRNRTGSLQDGGLSSYAASNQTLGLASRLTDKGNSFSKMCTNGDDVEADRIFTINEDDGEIAVGNFIKKKLVRVISRFKFPNKPQLITVKMAPNNKQVYVSDQNNDKLYCLDIVDEKELKINDLKTINCLENSGPGEFFFNKEGNRLYVLNRNASTIDVYDYSDESITLLQTIDSYKHSEEITENIAYNFKFNEDESCIYVVNQGDDSLVLFNVLEDGRLEYSDFVDVAPEPVDLIIFKKIIIVLSRRGALVESYIHSTDRGGLILETNSTYLVTQGNSLTAFVNNY